MALDLPTSSALLVVIAKSGRAEINFPCLGAKGRSNEDKKRPYDDQHQHCVLERHGGRKGVGRGLRNRPPVKMLGETMADIAEEFTTRKYRHLMATRRTIGNRSAYFGTPAVSWLLPTLEEISFPELFSTADIN